MTVCLIRSHLGLVIWIPLYKDSPLGPSMTQRTHVWLDHHIEGSKV